MINYITLVSLIVICIGCSSNQKRQKNLLLTSIKENMETQILINEVAIANWKKVQTGFRDEIQPGEDATKNLISLKNKMFTDSTLTTNDFKIQETLDSYSELEMLDTSIEYKENLTLPEKIKLFTFSYKLTCWLTTIKRGSYCGFTLFDEKYFVLPKEGKNDRILITYLDPQKTNNGEIIFHQKNNLKTKFNIPSIFTEKEPWTIAVPNNQKLLVIEWTDSMNGYKRQFTWPNYNYLP